MEEYHFYLKDQADKQSRFAFFSRAELSDTFQSKRQLTSLFKVTGTNFNSRIISKW